MGEFNVQVQLWKKNSKYVASFNAYFVVNFNRDVEFTQRPLFSGGGVAFALTPDTTGVVGTGPETFGLFPINEQTGASLRGAATKTVAVEMDLSRISNVGFDPLAPHVGLDINSMKSVKTKYLGDANTVIDVKVPLCLNSLCPCSVIDASAYSSSHHVNRFVLIESGSSSTSFDMCEWVDACGAAWSVDRV